MKHTEKYNWTIVTNSHGNHNPIIMEMNFVGWAPGNLVCNKLMRSLPQKVWKVTDDGQTWTSGFRQHFCLGHRVWEAKECKACRGRYQSECYHHHPCPWRKGYEVLHTVVWELHESFNAHSPKFSQNKIPKTISQTFVWMARR